MKPTITKNAEAPVVRAYGDSLQFHLCSQQTDGTFAMFTDTTPPGGGPPPHFHLQEDEWWYVLEGQPEFFDGERWFPVAPGDAVYMPKNSLHTFRNAGNGPLRQIIHTAPGGFEHFFRKSEAEFAKGGAPDLARICAIGAEHGIHFPTLDAGCASLRGAVLRAPVAAKAQACRLLHAFGEEVRVLLDGGQTGGLFTAFVETTPPGGGPPPHYHEREDEWFYVLEGTVSFFVGGQWSEAQPGDVVLAPRQSVHTFKNNTQQATRMFIHASPSGFETFFAEAAAEFAQPGGPDMQRAVAIAGRHGIHFVT